MLDSNYCQTMADYNRWMNQKLYTICAEISDVERKRDRGAFFKSIHSTLNHLLYGDRAWMGRFTNNPFCVKVMGHHVSSRSTARPDMIPEVQYYWLLSKAIASRIQSSAFEFFDNPAF